MPVLLGPPGRRFWLAGLGDQIAYWLGQSPFEGVDDLPGTLARVRSDEPVILLAHEPDIFTDVPARSRSPLPGTPMAGRFGADVAPVWTPSPMVRASPMATSSRMAAT